MLGEEYIWNEDQAIKDKFSDVFQIYQEPVRRVTRDKRVYGKERGKIIVAISQTNDSRQKPAVFVVFGGVIRWT